jgi:putative heme transporter
MSDPEHADPADRVPPALAVPRAVRVAAEWSWRLLAIAAAVVAVALLANRLKLLLLALFVALLVAALLAPVVQRAERVTGGRRGWATLAVLVLCIVLLVGVLSLLAVEVSSQVNQLSDKFTDGLDQIRSWLRDTFNVDDARIQQWVQQVVDQIRSNRESLLSGALSGTRIALEVLSGAAIALFATVFFLLDGERIWAWVVSLFPQRSQGGVREAGSRSWRVLTAYVRATMIIAVVDAVAIGTALAILRVPLALPLAVLVFFGAFVPIVGAFVTGFVAVVVALAARGPLVAVLVLVAIIVIQQVEGHLLQPLLTGKLVKLHPLGVVLAVTAGSVLAGLVGAIVAVPLAAVLTTVIGYYGGLARAPTDVLAATPTPEALGPADPAASDG